MSMQIKAQKPSAYLPRKPQPNKTHGASAPLTKETDETANRNPLGLFDCHCHWRWHGRFTCRMVVSMNYPSTPQCPKDLFQFECSVEDVDLVCFLEYSPEEKGYRDSYGAPYEPDIEECMTLNNAYIAGTDVDIAHMILQSMVDHIEVTALAKYKDNTP